MSELRIRQLSTLGRTAYRTRSYLVVGTLACFGFAIQLAIVATDDARYLHHWGRGPIAYLLFAAAGLIGSFKFAARVMEVQRGINADLRARELEEQEAAKHPPDLSTLSDGSQHARNLERMFEDPTSDKAITRSPIRQSTKLRELTFHFQNRRMQGEKSQLTDVKDRCTFSSGVTVGVA